MRCHFFAPGLALLASCTVALAELPAGFNLQGDRWTVGDGSNAVRGILLKPDGPGPFPAVLISHGLGGSGESFGRNNARDFLAWGFVCIAPDYTHEARAAAAMRQGGNRQAASEFGARPENLRRARLCLDILRGLSCVDTNRLAAFGHSMGGFVTVGLIADVTNAVRAAAISGSGIAPQEGYPAPSAARAEAIRIPLLMLHGSVDPVVRPEQSAQLQEVLNRHSVTNRRVVLEGEAHQFSLDGRARASAEMRAWLTAQGLMP